MLKRSFWLVFILGFLSFSLVYAENVLKSGSKSQPIIINGDTVEYSADNQEVTAFGNVEIIYGNTKLTCQKISVNTQTKEGIASGHARLEEDKGIIEGEKIIYNFQNKTGNIIDAQFRANPYFGRARVIDKEGEKGYVARYGYATTCSFDRPHYRIGSKQIDIIPKEKIQTKDDYLYLGGFPLIYLPHFNHTFEDPIMHWSVLPGKSKDWGPYLLSEARFSLTDNIEGRGYLDYRNKLGWAQGFGANYTSDFGKGDFKFYYTDEKPHKMPKEAPSGFQRYFFRFRHKWVIDKQTNFIAEFLKIRDARRKYDTTRDFFKDYFFREYEKNEKPLNYALFHHSFAHSSLDVLVQKRKNHWFNQLDKLPEIKYVLPSLKLGNSPLYFDNKTVAVAFNKMAVTSPETADDLTVSRLDMTNKVSLPMKLAFIEFSPFVQSRQTAYDKGANDKNLPIRTIFYTGVDMSTKFYRLFDIKSNLLGLDLDGLRHVITPTIGYSYNHKPTIPFYNLKRVDEVDLLTSSNAAKLELSNKLQTRRKDKDGKMVKIDLVDFLVSTTYAFAPNIVYGTKINYIDNVAVNEVDTANIRKGRASFSDFLFKLKLLPYSWIRIEADATYKHSGLPTDNDSINNNHFSNVNYDFEFNLAPERSIGFGQRYERKGQSQVTASFKWRINPKWKFSMYERYNLKSYLDTSVLPNDEVDKTTLEEEYTISRNLHCWDVDFTFNRKENHGSTIFIIFRLKAFPENEFGFDQSYNQPKSGA